MYLDQNTAPFFNGTGYQPFGDPSASQGDPDTDMLRAEKLRRMMQATPTQRPTAGQMNVSEPSLWGQALGQGPAAQQPLQQQPQQQPQLGGPGLNIEQLAAKGINVPETRQAFSGTDLVSTMRSPMGGGYKAGEMLSKETTTPMDDVSIARRMRGTNMGSLSRYMPEAVKESNKLIEEMGRQQTARDVEKDKYSAELAKLDTAESKQYSHEDALTHAQSVRDFQKKYPKATLEEAQAHASEQVAINQEGRRVSGIGIKRSRVPGATNPAPSPDATPAPKTPLGGKTLKTEQQRSLAAEIFGTADAVNPVALRQKLPGYEPRLQDAGSLQALSDVMAEGGGGNMGVLDTLGQDYIRRAIAQGVTSHETPFGTVSVAPAMEERSAGGNIFGGVSGKGKQQTGYHLMLNGQPLYHVPNHKIDTGGIFTPGTFSLQGRLDREAATNPTVAALLAPILQGIGR